MNTYETNGYRIVDYIIDILLFVFGFSIVSYIIIYLLYMVAEV